MQGGSKYIRPGAKEPIEIQLFDYKDEPLLGKTDIFIRIRRHADDLYFDWNDATFKDPTLVVEMYQQLSLVSDTYSPGIYRLNRTTVPSHTKGFDTSKITNPGTDDTYDITIEQIGDADAIGLPTGYELHVDSTILTPTLVAEAVWDAQEADHQLAGSFGDAVQRTVALQKENYFIDQMTYNQKGLLLSGRIRLFRTKVATLAATDGGTGEGEFAVYSFVATESPTEQCRARTARSVRDS